MSIERLNTIRSLLGKACAVFCILFVIATIDGLQSRFRQATNVLHLLGGDSVMVNGPLDNEPRDVADLGYISNSEQIILRFDAVHTGFWLGGQMWRGELSVDPTIRPGDYAIVVISGKNEAQKPFAAFLVKVYEDPAALRKDSMSVLQRFVNVSPWRTSAASFLLTLSTLLMVFMVSHKREKAMAGKGMAEVYLVRIVDEGHEICFGFGKDHGLEPGSRVSLLDDRGTPVTTVQVLRVSQKDGLAIVDRDYSVRPGFIVRILE